MKYQLVKDIKSNYNTIEQILTNRGIKREEIEHYLNTTDEDINEPELLGEENLKAAAIQLIRTIAVGDPALVVVDCDCDGFTSAAILMNYLYKIFPSWVENNLYYYLHENKAHGLEDCIDWIIERNFPLVIVLDARK